MKWEELPLFSGIDLHDSFVLGWKFEGGSLCFELEASIWPESKYYVPPKPGEHTCYRKATLQFLGAKEVVGLKPISSVRFMTDPDGSIDYGNIDSLVISNGDYSVSGEFGVVKIYGGELRFEVHT